MDTLSPLVAMHLLDGSCVIVGKFFEILRSPTPSWALVERGGGSQVEARAPKAKPNWTRVGGLSFFSSTSFPFPLLRKGKEGVESYLDWESK